MSQSPVAADRKSWWKGTRGEWYVVVQVVLIGLLLLGPRTLYGQPAWPFPFPQAASIVGIILIFLGAGLLLAGLVYLGKDLTPLPYPKEEGKLIQSGPYSLVRHPMYCGGLILSVGWALYVQGWLTLAYVAVLFVFLDVKSRREERWLAEKFPSYADYQRRVRKLIPFVY